MTEDGRLREELSRQGFSVLPGFLPEPVLDEMIASLERLRAIDHAGATDPEQGLYNVHRVAQRDPAMEELLCRGPLGRLAVELQGETRLYLNQFVVKPPRCRDYVPWHRDFEGTEFGPHLSYTLWLAIDDARYENGCLIVIPGSHRQDGGRPVPVEVARGSLVVLCSALLHCSAANTSDTPRRAFQGEFAQADAESIAPQRVPNPQLVGDLRIRRESLSSSLSLQQPAIEHA